jgi:gliding motility-associated-like protein
MRMQRVLLVLILLLNGGKGWAQGENDNWTFNFLYGINFGPLGPAFQSSSFRHFGGCSTISDAKGQLLFYTNGNMVWDKEHNPMPTVCSTCDDKPALLSAGSGPSRGVLIVQKPGSQSLYYIFTTDSQLNLLNGGLCYTEVDLSLRAGLGGVTAVRNVRLPTPALSSKVTEGVIGMQHTNRRDVWVLVHGLGDNVFYSFLVTATGVSTTPVASTSGSFSTNLSTMKFAPDGKRLVRCGLYMPVELFDFDAATGLVANAQVLDTDVTSYRIHDFEFSADATKLYQSQSRLGGPGVMRTDGFLYQYDLQAGATAAIRASKQLVYQSLATDESHLPPSALEIGPDGRIYTASSPFVGIMDRPNRRGMATNYRHMGLPHTYIDNVRGVSDNELQNVVRRQPPVLDYMAEPVCAGGTLTLTPYELPTGTGPLTWTFFDPLTNKVDSVQGVSVTRTFPVPGAYPVTLSTTSRGQYYRFRRTVLVSPLPSVALSDTVRLCQGSSLVLSVPTPPGTTVRWSDGSTASSLQVATPGRYQVEVRNYQGCVSIGSTVAVTCYIPNIVTPNGDSNNEAFRLLGLEARQWDLELYNRWGQLIHRQSNYDNSWRASQQPDGTYYYRLHNPRTGQQLKGWVEVLR